MDYDLTRLTQIGDERAQLLARLEELRPEAYAEITAADAAGVPQKTLAERAHYTREIVRQVCLTPEQREAEKKKRRERTRKKD